MHERSSSRRRFGTGSIALSLGLCLCAGQLVGTPAAAAASTTTTSAAVAAATGKVNPSIANSVNTTRIGWGSKVRVTSIVKDPRTGKGAAGTVSLQGWRNGKWVTWQTKAVPSSGLVRFYSKPLITGYVRTKFNGSGSLNWRAGKTLKVAVVVSGAKVLAEANRHKGALYLYGAAGPKRFDCSGFTKYVYKKAAGRKLPHKANSQQKYGKGIAKKNRRIGDLIIFRSGSYGYHAGIYAGGNYMYDSPRAGKRVSKRKMISSNYVVRRLV